LFKTDTEIHGVTVPVDDLALQALVAHELTLRCKSGNNSFSVIHPTYFYSGLQTGTDSLMGDEKNPGLIRQLAQIQLEVDARASELESKVKQPLASMVEISKKQRTSIVQLTDELKDPKTSKAKKDKDHSDLKRIVAFLQRDATEAELDLNRPCDELCISNKLLQLYTNDQIQVEARIAALKSISAKISDLISALNKPDSNGITPLQTMLRAESLAAKKGDGANTLVTKFVTIGGNNITRKRVMGSRASFGGGVVVDFIRIDSGGLIAQSGIVQCYAGRLKEDELPGKLDGDSVKQIVRCTSTPAVAPVGTAGETQQHKPRAGSAGR